DAARLAVAPLHRSGGQAQFILRNTALAKHIAERTELDEVLAWIEQQAHRELTLRDIADRAAMSVRTLNRRFQAETGHTPMQWLTGVRVRHAQQLLESTAHGVEKIGRDVGFSSPANFREQFRRLTGVAPQSYRNTFRDRLGGCSTRTRGAPQLVSLGPLPQHQLRQRNLHLRRRGRQPRGKTGLQSAQELGGPWVGRATVERGRQRRENRCPGERRPLRTESLCVVVDLVLRPEPVL